MANVIDDLENIDNAYKEYFNSIRNPKYQKFILYRGRGMTLENAWVGAGLIDKNAKSNASSWLKNNPNAKELIKMLQTQNQLKSLSDENSMLSKEIMANSKKGLTALEIAKTKTGEEAESMNFYINVIRGGITSKETTTTTDSNGNVTTKEVVKEPTITEKMKAREKLDQILGIDSIADKLGKVDLPNGMQITIVDVSNKEMKEESNQVMNAEVVEEMEVDDDGVV